MWLHNLYFGISLWRWVFSSVMKMFEFLWLKFWIESNLSNKWSNWMIWIEVVAQFEAYIRNYLQKCLLEPTQSRSSIKKPDNIDSFPFKFAILWLSIPFNSNNSHHPNYFLMIHQRTVTFINQSHRTTLEYVDDFRFIHLINCTAKNLFF